MNSAQQQPDYCPHCHGLLEIVFVNFRLRGADMIVCCPNCAIAFTNNRAAPETAQKAESLKSLDSRFRRVLAFVFAAVITAATLRHAIHTYAGVPREEIRTNSLLALGAFVFLLIVTGIVFRRRQRN
jgi:LPXTG-motif cell wall-anchored protein